MRLADHASRNALALALFGCLSTGSPAEAHFQSADLSDFNAGVIHPLLTLQHAMALVAFGLLCGRRQAVLLRNGLPALAIGIIFGSASAYAFQRPSDFIAPPLIMFALLTGLAVAADYQVPRWVCRGIGLAIGAMIGFDSKPDDAGSYFAQMSVVTGTLIGIFLLYLNAAGIAAFATKQWQSIGIRVIGSWTSAAAFLNFALLFRK